MAEISINVELDPANDNYLDILVVEKRGEGQVYAEHYRVERTQRAKPGKLQARLATADEAKLVEKPLEERIREKVRARYEVVSGDSGGSGGGDGHLP
jgi:hypothetical protein